MIRINIKKFIESLNYTLNLHSRSFQFPLWNCNVVFRVTDSGPPSRRAAPWCLWQLLANNQDFIFIGPGDGRRWGGNWLLCRPRYRVFVGKAEQIFAPDMTYGRWSGEVYEKISGNLQIWIRWIIDATFCYFGEGSALYNVMWCVVGCENGRSGCFQEVAAP